MVVVCGGEGGGDGGDDKTSEGKTFNLYEPDFFTPGHKESWSITSKAKDLSGFRDPDTLKVTGSYLIEVKDKTTYDGQEALPIVELISISLDNTPLSSTTATTYIDNSGYPICEVDNDTNEIDIPIKKRKIPPIGEIGDFGELTTWKKPNGSTITGQWRLESASGGLAKLISNRTGKDSSGATIWTREMTTTINEFGETIKKKNIIHLVESKIRIQAKYTLISKSNFLVNEIETFHIQNRSFELTNEELSIFSNIY